MHWSVAAKDKRNVRNGVIDMVGCCWEYKIILGGAVIIKWAWSWRRDGGPGFTQIIINYKSLVTNCYVVLLGYFDASYKQNITWTTVDCNVFGSRCTCTAAMKSILIERKLEANYLNASFISVLFEAKNVKYFCVPLDVRQKKQCEFVSRSGGSCNEHFPKNLID